MSRHKINKPWFEKLTVVAHLINLMPDFFMETVKIPTLSRFLKRYMRKISLWAKHHRIAAIAFLIALKLLLVLAGWFVGTWLQEMGVDIPSWSYLLVLVIFIPAALFYPSRKQSNRPKQAFYIRQKTCDLAIAFCAFISITVFVNTNFSIAFSPVSFASTTVSGKPTAEEILASLQYRDKKTLTRQEKKILRQEVRKQMKVLKSAFFKGDEDAVKKTLLIILTICVAAGLIVLIAALACSLACNGAEAAALILTIFGMIGVLIGAGFVIRAILRAQKTQEHFN